MKIICILIISVFYFGSAVIAEEKDVCKRQKNEHDYEYCINTTTCIEKEISSLKPIYIKTFLQTFSDKRCINNVEYSEWSNELIYTVIQENPYLFFDTLFSLPNSKSEKVLEEIYHPLLDQHWLKTYEAIKNSSLKTEYKNKALHILKKAYKLDTDNQKVRIKEFD